MIAKPFREQRASYTSSCSDQRCRNQRRDDCAARQDDSACSNGRTRVCKSADDAALLARFGLYGPPGILFFDPQGKQVPAATVIGYQDADKFLATLNSVYGSQEGACALSLAC